jgi:plastocyanin
MKKLMAALVLLGLVTLLVVACGGSSGSGSTDVHMNSNNFVQTSITISKGSSINLTDDVSVIHIVSNGSWVNNSPQPAAESGAPVVSNLMFNGNDSHQIGPFTTAGTFHYYCSVHPGMNLTVTVQ